MKIYIASKLENYEQVRYVRDFLARFGHTLTYDWTLHGSIKETTEQDLTDCANAELQGVRDADIVLVLLPGGRGTHAELGMAIALNKPVYIWSATHELFTLTDKTCAFYWNNNVLRHVCPIESFVTNISTIQKINVNLNVTLIDVP